MGRRGTRHRGRGHESGESKIARQPIKRAQRLAATVPLRRFALLDLAPHPSPRVLTQDRDPESRTFISLEGSFVDLFSWMQGFRMLNPAGPRCIQGAGSIQDVASCMDPEFTFVPTGSMQGSRDPVELESHCETCMSFVFVAGAG
jgi:hypothetical protein